MTKLTSTAVVAAAASVVGLLFVTTVSTGTPLASASPPSDSAAMMPLSSKFRACDFTPLKWVSATGYARPIAHVASTGTGTLVAAVDINTAVPNTHYDIRVIQMPRPSIGCAPGDPGVIVGGLQTDAVGAASTTLQGPIRSGATGAWVIVERPAEFSQKPAEYYTTTYVAAI